MTTFNRFLTIPSRLSVLFLFYFFLGLPRLGSGQESPYFPERGPAAIFQRSLDLQNLGLVLSIALEPGFEDLATLAYLRMARGARVISLYMTNGEATPSDLNGETPFRLAARRKEEAYRSMTYIGGETYFLNFADMGIVNDTSKLEHFWNPDTVIARLTEVIRTYRPDVVLINRDLRGEPGVTLRQSTLQDFLLNAIRAVQDSMQTGTTKVGSDMLSWKVQRIFVDKGTQKQPFQMNIDLRHPSGKKSYREIAEEAVENYESLRAQIPAWRKQEDRSYTLLFPGRSEAPSSFDSGLELVSPRLQGIASAVAQVAKVARRAGSAHALGVLSMAVDSVVQALGWGTFKLTNPERRTLITWRAHLEDLRCSLLDVDIEFEVSDSLVTRRQLFFLKFTKFKAKVGRGKTEILFPGALTADWVVDESLEHRFPFEVPREFRILTPETLEFNAPLAVFGLDRATVRTNLSFIILHQDSLPERNFQYRKAIPLRVGPRFSSEILTPVVYVTPGERLVYRFQNLTRDGVYGETFVEDSLVSSDHKRFHLRTKDSSVLDTLTLKWRDSVPTGDHLVDVKISGVTVGRFVARKFDVAVDTTKKVGLITGLGESPLAEAMRRLHIPYVELDSMSLASADFSSLATIIIDRDAAALRQDLSAELPRVKTWARAGGHVILLPQYSLISEDLMFQEGCGFRLWPALDPESEISADTCHPLLTLPNMIRMGDWEGWIFARAFGWVQIESEQEVEIPVRSRDSGAPLVVTRREGKGLITYIALHLSPQLMNIHPGAYRLLANLVGHSYTRAHNK